MQQNKPNEIIDQLVSSSNVTKPSHFHSLQGTAQKGLLRAFFFFKKKEKKRRKKKNLVPEWGLARVEAIIQFEA